MKLQIINIGAIEHAEIELEGITIIAGENNVGKSTVGKTLYAFLHDMDLWRKTYDEICSSRIEKYLYVQSISLEDWCMKVSGAQRRRTNRAVQLQKQYADSEDFRIAIEDYQTAENKTQENDETSIEHYLENYCRNYIGLYIKYNIEEFLSENQGWVRDWKRKAVEGISSLELEELKIQSQTIKQSLQDVFGNQYRKIGTVESNIQLCDDDRKVTFTISGNAEKLDYPVRATNRIYFIESPKIYDYLSNTRFGYNQKEYLRYLMSPNVFKKGSQIPKIDSDEYGGNFESGNTRVQGITERLEKVMGGKAEFFQKVGLEFKDKHIIEPIHSVNVSTGLKSLALLEYALRIGAIEEKDILILDEPEINLHPEWQLEYAESLVQLHKEFQLNIIVTTHSPYFIRALECFSDWYEVMGGLNVYSMKRECQTGATRVDNVSYSEYGMTALYDELSAPLEELEELLDKKYKKEQ